MMTFEQTREAVNELLAGYFIDRTTAADALSPQYGRLWQTMAALNQAGGKRFRPYMVVLAYDCFGGTDRSSILPVAGAWELLHMCMLIHDDIIDNDTVRYGVKNVAGRYIDIYADQPQLDTARRLHYATSAALLAGDLALSAAHDLVLTAGISAEQQIQAQRGLLQATFAVAGGELLDTEAAHQPMATANPALVAHLKTASYSFVGPLRAGAELAGATDRQIAAITEYGEAVGQAFQLVDDLIGIFGDPTVTGKSATGDISEGKRTFLMQETFRTCSETDRSVLERLVGKSDLDETEAAAVRAIISSSGARGRTEALIEQHASRANMVVDGLDIADAGRQQLRELIAMATHRSF